MKRRILISSLITVIFALIVVTSSFIIFINIKEIDETKEILSGYNNLIVKNKMFNNELLEGFTINDKNVRFTIVDKSGIITKDTESIYNDKEIEIIIEEFNNGNSSFTKYSEIQGVNIIYNITNINEDKLIIASVEGININRFTKEYIKYYLIIIFLVLLLSVGVSIKLIKGIIYPLKELEIQTKRIVNGDYNKRVEINSEDEIGYLANIFNKMAEQLNDNFIDSMDKQNKLESILESMESGVLAIDNRKNVILINSYAKTLFGINKNIIGESILEYIIDYDLISFIKSIHDIETKEIRLMHPIHREIRIKKAPIINSEKLQIGTVITVLDITDIKKLENIRSQFVANVSHELKTPLTSIKGFAETLKYVEDIETKNKFLNIIDKEAERLTNLINDILILSDIENNYSMKKEEFKPSEVIQDVINMFDNQVNNKDVEINFINKDSKEIIGDRDKFYQMILNLVENAIKYSGEKVKVNLCVYESKYYQYIEIEDNGIGIPEEDLPRIFERFYRVDKSRAKGGTGLGLAIVKHIVKMFNGEIYVDSILNKGTKFTIKIRKTKKIM